MVVSNCINFKNQIYVYRTEYTCCVVVATSKVIRMNPLCRLVIFVLIRSFMTVG